jgi:hypothetical protein
MAKETSGVTGVEKGHQCDLVVTAQQNEALAQFLPCSQEQIHHPARVGPTVYVVPNHDHETIFGCQFRKGSFEPVGVPMDITQDCDADTVRDSNASHQPGGKVRAV